MIKSTKNMTTITMLIAISIIFHMVESMVPLPIPIPGFRLGLANIVGLIALYLFDAKTMISINVMRVVLASLLRGVIFGTGFWLSLCGVMLSSLACIIAKKKSPMSMFGVSVAGSVFHSVGQVIAVTFIYQQFFMQAVLPILTLLSIPTGLFVALMAQQVLKRIHKIGKEEL
ncbi:MAG: Gx transporter family protein [Longicatena sp.]